MSYEAIICRIESIRPIEKADRIVAATVLGTEVVVSVATKVGDLGVFFPTDGIFEDAFCEANDLFPKLDANGKKVGGGFFGGPGKARIRAQGFRGVKSHGFWCPTSYLAYTGADLSKLKEGDRFDTLNGVLIAKKYFTPATIRAQANAAMYKKKAPSSIMFKEHKDTDQFRYCGGDIPKGALISLQSKRHGTSWRASYTYVSPACDWFTLKASRVLSKIGLYRFSDYLVYPFARLDALICRFKEQKTRQYLLGTRHVTLFPKDKEKEGYHGSEAFRYEVIPLIESKLPFGYTLFGEITGWANEKPIMAPHDLTKPDFKEIKNQYPTPMYFAYGDVEGTHTFAIYHATFCNEDGYCVDLSWEEVKRIAATVGLKHTFELEPEFVYDGDLAALQAKVKSYIDKPDPEDPRHYTEGVIVRYTVGNQTRFLKEKSYWFKLGEGIIKTDETQVDTEEAA